MMTISARKSSLATKRISYSFQWKHPSVIPRRSRLGREEHADDMKKLLETHSKERFIGRA
jgi:hypothetical protein